jgi:hypothetical protein
MTTFDAEQQDALMDQQFQVDTPPGQRLRRALNFTGGPDGKLPVSRPRPLVVPVAKTNEH